MAGVVLAAGAGTRLRPLTYVRAKPLCPVANVPLVDHAIRRVEHVTSKVAVNVHHGRESMEQHLWGRVHLSVEAGEALGTAGALGKLRDWIDGRPTLLTNADAWLSPDLDLGAFVDGWDGERVRLLVVEDAARPDFEGHLRYAGVALMPWRDVEPLGATPTGLYELVWQGALAAGRLDLVAHPGAFVDCGTPRGYLAANLLASGGENVIAPGAFVHGDVVRSVVWPGTVVYPAERIVEGIKVTELVTVLVR